MKQESTDTTSEFGAGLKEPTECYDPFLLADDHDWLNFMEPVLCENSGAADSLARLLFRLKEAIESGPEGVARASFTLSDGIRLAYKYTEAHKAALRLYNLSLTGALKPDDEPLHLIREALARGGDRTKRPAGTKRPRRRPRR
ncbi:MAG TPA: hypothetical protein VJ302_30015 [Blastocatellia bacterium]|nr:hypothetical protein [Blastocatellia bacterium]